MFDIKDGVLFGACLEPNQKVVELPGGIVKIAQGAFNHCEDVEKLVIPEGVVSIGEGAFYGCVNLKDVVFPDSLVTVERGAFYKCLKLNNVFFFDNVKFLGEEAFGACVGLKNIRLSNNLSFVSSAVFLGCNSLRKIEIPQGVTFIGESAFSGCEMLEEIVLPESVELVESKAFEKCARLQNVRVISEKVVFEEGAFCGCEGVETFMLKIVAKNFNENNLSFFERFNFVYKGNGGYLFSLCEINNDEWKKMNLESINQIAGSNNLICLYLAEVLHDGDLEKLGNLKYLLKHILKDEFLFEGGRIDESLFNNNRFNLLLKRCEKNSDKSCKVDSLKFYGLFKFAYSIGAFSDDDIQRQKACEAIANYVETFFLPDWFVRDVLSKIKLKPYNKEWADFVMGKNQNIYNFKELIKYSKIDRKFILDVYDNFENIREFGRSNKGKQKYRKVTIKLCREYFDNSEFLNVNSRNADIAKELFKFTRKQETFDNASKIRDEYLDGGVKENIIDGGLKETIQSIDEQREIIVSYIRDTVDVLGEISKSRFTYEYLSKYDPSNFVLGKYCSCCAHLEGVGYGIMRASILHPDMQNLVIRDINGRIVAKSTLYVNRSQGYALFNTFEKDVSYSMSKVEEMIYETFIRGVKDFVIKYNDQNKEVPITRVNIGSNSNSLYEIFEKRHVKTEDVLAGVHFSLYGIREKRYDGDWEKNGQYIILDLKDKSKIK